MLWFFRIALAGVGLSLLILANLTGEAVNAGFPWDKLNHFIAFAVLSVLTVIAFPHAHRARLLLALLLFNAGIEISQLLMGQGREPDVMDWTAGALATLGVLGCAGIWQAWKGSNS